MSPPSAAPMQSNDQAALDEQVQDFVSDFTLIGNFEMS